MPARFWSAAVLCRFGFSEGFRNTARVRPSQSGRGQPHTKTLARFRMRVVDSPPPLTPTRESKESKDGKGGSATYLLKMSRNHSLSRSRTRQIDPEAAPFAEF